MANKLYVGNLSYDTTKEALVELFSQAGPLLEIENGEKSAVLIIDHFTGRPKGFGFVEMADEESAKKAVEMFDGYELDGWKIVVNEARPLKPRTEGGFNRGGGSSRPGGYSNGGGNSRSGGYSNGGGNSRSSSNGGGYDRDNRSRDW